MRGIAIALCIFGAWCAQGAERPKYSTEFILTAIMSYMGVANNPEFPVPNVYFESETPLSQFQEAIKDQWGFVPEAFSNAYSSAKNEIFVSDDSAYYKKVHRYIDDSIAHELAHYVQFKYQNYDLINDPTAEMLAIDVQSWFRESYMKD